MLHDDAAPAKHRPVHTRSHQAQRVAAQQLCTAVPQQQDELPEREWRVEPVRRVALESGDDALDGISQQAHERASTAERADWSSRLAARFQVNPAACSLPCSRRADARSRSAIRSSMAPAIARASRGSTKTAASPYISRSTGRSETMQGVPHAIASSGGSPKLSARVGKQNAAACE